MDLHQLAALRSAVHHRFARPAGFGPSAPTLKRSATTHGHRRLSLDMEMDSAITCIASCRCLEGTAAGLKRTDRVTLRISVEELGSANNPTPSDFRLCGNRQVVGKSASADWSRDRCLEQEHRTFFAVGNVHYVLERLLLPLK